MVADYWKHVPRRPRHAAVANDEIRVEIEMVGDPPPAPLAAELVDFSLSGAGVVLADPLATGENVVIRFAEGDTSIAFSFAGTVRWRRREGDRWLIGLLFNEPIGWEVLGELFLQGILSHDLPTPQPIPDA